MVDVTWVLWAYHPKVAGYGYAKIPVLICSQKDWLHFHIWISRARLNCALIWGLNPSRCAERQFIPRKFRFEKYLTCQSTTPEVPPTCWWVREKGLHCALPGTIETLITGIVFGANIGKKSSFSSSPDLSINRSGNALCSTLSAPHL